jgi:diguanylate cyclase (GGDEF)-like protein/PAS domain S-box-containing protein
MSDGELNAIDDQDAVAALRERVRELEALNERLKSSEERFQILFEHAPDGYYLSDLKGFFVDGNAAAESITGYSRAELVGRNFLSLGLLSPGGVMRAALLLAKNVIGRSTGPDEFALIRKDGSIVPVEIRTHPVTIGKRRLVLGIARDISDRRRVEQDLRERVKELQAFYRLSDIAETRGSSLDELCQELAEALPQSWQHDDIACARIELRAKEYLSANFARSEWKQSAPVRVDGGVVGAIEIFYLEERPEADEGPFLDEERHLLTAIAERLGRITERKETEEALRASELRYRALFDGSRDGMVLTDRQTGKILDCNEALCQLVGRAKTDLVGRPQAVLHPDQESDEAGANSASWKPCASASGCLVEADVISESGRRSPVEIRAAPVTIGGRSCLLAMFRDISERKELQEKLAHMARHDPLTGVLNRYALSEMLGREAARSKRYAHPIGFLMVDVNRFKEINDRFGHGMGDKVLQGVADVLKHNLRESDILVRYGGDEFLVILPETNGDTEVVKERILAEVALRNVTNPLLEFPVTLAIGTVHWSPDSGQTIDHALEEADRRMYADKCDGSSPAW